MGPKRISRTAEEWKKITKEWSASGQRAPDYCAQHGIGLSSFLQWRTRLKKETGNKRGARAFAAMGSIALPMGAPVAVVRWPDGAKIELSQMPDPEWVRRVLGA